MLGMEGNDSILGGGVGAKFRWSWCFKDHEGECDLYEEVIKGKPGEKKFKIATTTRTHKTTWSLVNKPEEESILPRTIHKTLGMHQATGQTHTQASTIGEIP